MFIMWENTFAGTELGGVAGLSSVGKLSVGKPGEKVRRREPPLPERNGFFFPNLNLKLRIMFLYMCAQIIIKC